MDGRKGLFTGPYTSQGRVVRAGDRRSVVASTEGTNMGLVSAGLDSGLNYTKCCSGTLNKSHYLLRNRSPPPPPGLIKATLQFPNQVF